MDSLVESDNAEIPWYKIKSEYVHTNDWLHLSSPITTVTILFLYLVFILKLGPAFMENREPYKLKMPLLIYNIIQVWYSLYVFQLGCSIIYKYGIVDTKCMLNDKDAQKTIMDATFIYYTAKVSELMDTVFFVLRKKKNQITFLHWYHHCLMMLSTFLTMKYSPTYTTIFLGTINSLVHVIMYGYYGLSAFPIMEKYLWWKKYLTSFQLIQFVLIIIHVVVAYFVTECPPSYFLFYDVVFNAFLMIYLFGDFYVKSYLKKDGNSNGSNFSKNNKKQGNDELMSTGGVTRRYIENKFKI